LTEQLQEIQQRMTKEKRILEDEIEKLRSLLKEKDLLIIRLRDSLQEME